MEASKRRWLAMPVKWVKIGFLLAYLACDHAAMAERVASLGLSAGLLLYIGLYAVLALCLGAAAFIPRTGLRFAMALVLVAASIALQSYEWATRHVLDYNAFETMLASRGDTGDALSQHGAVLWKSVPTALLLLLGLILPPRGWRLPGWAAVGAPLAGLGLLSVMLYIRGGEGARALPAPFVPLAHASILGAVSLTEAGQERLPVTLQPTQPRGDGDIVILVDESVAANYLDINNAQGVRSGLKEARPGLAIHNYGIAASVTNCSPGSNKTLRFGGTRDNYRLAARIWPSIWAYARKAGYRTVYMDGQRTGGELQNLATPEERAEIDDFIQLPDVPVRDRDMELARLVRARIDNGVQELIYVNKVGGHFPVADKYPDSLMRYHPALERGAMADITDMGPVHADFDGNADYWRRYRNAYRNTMLWNTGAFFDRLLAGLDPSRAIILYTSDHGQDLHERGQEGKATHCINDPAPEEGAVPLAVIDSAESPRLGWTESMKRNRDGMSHFRLFPTILTLMGYDSTALKANYGPTLIATDPDPMTFTINYFSALGKEPTWRRVVPGNLSKPPISDQGGPATQ
jgi:glucan phosphoethanolaminetransferase (alkaline phosphatase superfamily)